MPFYEYECSACKHHAEVLQKISDAPLKKCPNCGKQTLKRLISAPVFRLKGGGWYETDFKSDQETKRNLAGRDEAPAAEGGTKEATATTEAKPEKADKPAGTAVDKAEKKIMVTKPALKAGAATKPKAKSKPAPRKAVKKKSTGRR